MRYSSKLLICLCLTLAIVLVYGQVIDFDFVGFDDELYVSGNRHLKNGLNPENVAWAFTFHGYSYWQPLTWLSHMLDYQLFGLMSGWHHLSNLTFHFLNTLLLFLALNKMTGALWRSAFVAALFALHPLNVESVAWVAARKNVLSVFFWMLTLLAYIWYTKQPELYRYLTVIIVFMLGLMAKPVLISLPFVLLLLDYWPLGRMRFGKSISAYPKSGSIVISNYQWSIVFRMILEKTPFFILSAGTVCLSTLSVYHLGSIVSIDTVPMSLRVANVLFSYMSYIGKIIWPHNLAVFYPYPDSLPLWQPAVSALFLAVISATVYIKKRRCPYLAVGWFWYIVTLIPVSGLMQAGLWPAMADRFTYIPSIGLFMLIAWGLPDVLGKGRYKNMMLTMLAGVVLLCFMICTVLQTRYWKNDIALFQHALSVTDNNWPSHYNLGIAWNERGKFDEAVLQFEQVLKIKPANAGARNNLAKILFNHGKFEEAALQLKEALKYNPHDADICNNLAVIFASQNKFDEAISLFEQAIRINSEYADAHFNLGSLLARQGKFKSAGRHCAEAIRIKPDYAEAYYQIGNILTHQGKYKKACIFFSRAIIAKPDFVKAQINFEKYLKLCQPKQKALGNNEVID